MYVMPEPTMYLKVLPRRVTRTPAQVLDFQLDFVFISCGWAVLILIKHKYHRNRGFVGIGNYVRCGAKA